MKFFSFIKKHHLLFKSSFVLLLIVASFSVGVKHTKSIVPFGGMIVYAEPCLNGIMIVIGYPTPMSLMYMGGMLYPYGQIYRTGPWTLGAFAPGGVCSYTLVNVPTEGTIELVGTSM